MKLKISFASIAFLIATTVVLGCKENSSVASPSCAELDKVTDGARKAELLKQCPRGGPDFKQSPKKEW